MLRRLKPMEKFQILARDGDAGKTEDFYFDDREWTIRYLVAKTGSWFAGRKVLLSPEALGAPDWEAERLPVDLTREQVKNGPDIDLDRPVSRQKLIELHRHFGWRSPHWLPAEPYIPPAQPFGEAPVPDLTDGEKGDPHLRSTDEVTGYRIRGSDGDLGYVDDFLAEERDWIIRYLILDTRKWLTGRKVLLPPGAVRKVIWPERTVEVDLKKEEVESSPEYDPSTPPSREYETRLYEHYKWPRYWV